MSLPGNNKTSYNLEVIGGIGNNHRYKEFLYIDGHNKYSYKNIYQYTDPNCNLGNFNALLKLCINSGNNILKEHLLMCSKHSKYTSKTT